MDKMTKRQKQAINTKLNIIKVAMELFQNNGYENVTIRLICQEAAISVGAFYHHFKSKKELIEVGQESIDKVIIDELYEEEFEGSYEDILKIMDTSMKILESYGYEFVLAGYIEMLRNKGKYVISEERVLFCFLLDIIQKGKSNKLINKSIVEKEFVKDILRITRGAIYEWGLLSGDLDLVKLVHKDLELLLNSLK